MHSPKILPTTMDTKDGHTPAHGLLTLPITPDSLRYVSLSWCSAIPRRLVQQLCLMKSLIFIFKKIKTSNQKAFFPVRCLPTAS